MSVRLTPERLVSGEKGTNIRPSGVPQEASAASSAGQIP
jgi:hypothetical protein